MGPWHFEGHRRWDWWHNGKTYNGYVEFGAEGVLRTSLCTGGHGTWELRANGEMVLTFGNCHHIVALLVQSKGDPPTSS